MQSILSQYILSLILRGYKDRKRIIEKGMILFNVDYYPESRTQVLKYLKIIMYNEKNRYGNSDCRKTDLWSFECKRMDQIYGQKS